MEQLNKLYVFICPKTTGDAMMLKPGSLAILGRAQFPRFSKKISREHVEIKVLDQNQDGKISIKPLAKPIFYKKHGEKWKRLLTDEETYLGQKDVFSLDRNIDENLNSTFYIRYCSVGDFNRTEGNKKIGSIPNEQEKKEELQNERNSIVINWNYQNFRSMKPPKYNHPNFGTVLIQKREKFNWKMELLNYVKNGYKLPKYSESIYFEDETCVIIYDSFNKSQRHLLVLPRQHLLYLTDLNRSHISLIESMAERAEWISEHYEKEESIKMISGFHANPSMAQIHLHVISTDFNSNFLRKQSHYNSFNTPFLIPPRKISELLAKSGQISLNTSHYSKMLFSEMCCNRCKNSYKEVRELKNHLSNCVQTEFDDSYLNEDVMVKNKEMQHN